jgi:hypothetical protein
MLGGAYSRGRTLRRWLRPLSRRSCTCACTCVFSWSTCADASAHRSCAEERLPCHVAVCQMHRGLLTTTTSIRLTAAAAADAAVEAESTERVRARFSTILPDDVEVTWGAATSRSRVTRSIDARIAPLGGAKACVPAVLVVATLAPSLARLAPVFVPLDHLVFVADPARAAPRYPRVAGFVPLQRGAVTTALSLYAGTQSSDAA